MEHQFSGLVTNLTNQNAQYSQATLLWDWLKVWKAGGSPLLPKNLQFSRLICKTV